MNYNNQHDFQLFGCLGLSVCFFFLMVTWHNWTPSIKGVWGPSLSTGGKRRNENCLLDQVKESRCSGAWPTRCSWFTFMRLTCELFKLLKINDLSYLFFFAFCYTSCLSFSLTTKSTIPHNLIIKVHINWCLCCLCH